MVLLAKHARTFVFLPFGLVAGAGLATAYLAVRVGEADLWVEHTLQVEGTALALLNSVQDAESAKRGFVITGDDRYSAQANDSSVHISSVISELKELTSDNPAQLAALAELQDLTAVKVDRIRGTIALVKRAGASRRSIG